MPHLSVLIFGLLTVLPWTQAATRVTVPTKQPKYSRGIYRDLLGLSIELPTFPDWAGKAVGQPNQYANQLLENLKSLTNIAVPIRVGGTPEDYTYLNSATNYVNATYPPASASNPYPAATRVDISPSFYSLSGNLPSGTAFTWGLNLESLNVTEGVAQAKALYDAFYGSQKASTGNVYLSSVELGNEPDFYGNAAFGGTRPGFDIYAYVDAWTKLLSAITSNLNFDFNGAPKFQLASYSNAVAVSLWNPVTTIGAGLLESSIAKYIATYSAHMYMGVNTGNVSTNPAPGWLLTRENIRSNMTRHGSWASLSNRAGLDYILGETNSAARHGITGSSNTAEAAIWLVDYALQAASVGVARLFFHNGNGYAYNLAQPVAVSTGVSASTRPYVQGVYYGFYMVNDFIGIAGKPCIAELTTNTSSTAAYALYDNGNLKRAMLINFATYLPGAANRSSETISLAGLGNGKVTAKRFYTPYTNATSGMNWGGVNFESETGKPSGSAYTSTLSGPSVTLNASEIVMLSFQ